MTPFMWVRLGLAGLLVLGCIAVPMNAAAPEAPDVERAFAQTVQPFLKTYCSSCHSGARAAAQLDLRQYPTVDAVVQDFSRWNRILARLSRQGDAAETGDAADRSGAATGDRLDSNDVDERGPPA